MRREGPCGARCSGLIVTDADLVTIMSVNLISEFLICESQLRAAGRVTSKSSRSSRSCSRKRSGCRSRSKSPTRRRTATENKNLPERANCPLDTLSKLQNLVRSSKLSQRTSECFAEPAWDPGKYRPGCVMLLTCLKHFIHFLRLIPPFLRSIEAHSERENEFPTTKTELSGAWHQLANR